MSRLNLAGLILAIVLLVSALAAKTVGGADAVGVMLPTLTMILSVLTAIDIAAYKTSKEKERVMRASELVRTVSLAVFSVIMLAAVIVYYVI